MNREHQIWQGQLAEAEAEIRELELRMEMVRDTMRSLLNPVVEIGEIESDKVFDQAIQFRDLAISLEKQRGISIRARKNLGI